MEIARAAAVGVLAGGLAVITASVGAPLTGITPVLEMTGEQGQLFAVCATCSVAYLAAKALGDRPIYEALLEGDMVRRRAASS